MERHDDETLADDERLLRRIKKQQIIPDEKQADTYRPMSMAFRDGSDEVSVYVRSLTTVDAVLEGHAEYSLAEITVPSGSLRRMHSGRDSRRPQSRPPRDHSRNQGWHEESLESLRERGFMGEINTTG